MKRKMTTSVRSVVPAVFAAALVLMGCPAVVSGGSGFGSGNTGGGGNGDGQGNTTSLPGSFKPTTGDGSIDSVVFKMIPIDAVINQTIGKQGLPDNDVHQISLTAYMIGETEVTQEFFEAVMDGNPSKFNGTSGFEAETGEDQKSRPVELVNWYDCIGFCNELTRKTAGLEESECVYYSDPGFTKVYTKEDSSAKKMPYQNIDKKGFRLPTEAEWEWAAKGGTEDSWAGTNIQTELETYAWVSSNSDSKTHEVKSKKTNAYGLYGMSGNVLEWCWDSYSPRPPAGQDPFVNPDRISVTRRGGSWALTADNAAPYARDNKTPDHVDNQTGFRIVCRP